MLIVTQFRDKLWVMNWEKLYMRHEMMVLYLFKFDSSSKEFPESKCKAKNVCSFKQIHVIWSILKNNYHTIKIEHMVVVIIFYNDLFENYILFEIKNNFYFIKKI